MKVLFRIPVMFGKKQNLIVGLTTYHLENLAISISGLSQISERFTLIIYNDNPDKTVTADMVREYGYMGPLHIINGANNIGLMRARLAILDMVNARKKVPEWIVFVDDDDILLNVKVPDVSRNNFAVIQNMVVLRTRLRDVLRVIRDSSDYSIDDENVCLIRPHIGLSGTLIRTESAIRMGAVLRDVSDGISEIDTSLSFRAPTDLMMWSALNIVSRYDNDGATPIYMDTINYLATDLDSAPTKYGLPIAPAKNAEAQIRAALSKYDALIRAALSSAAPTGQE